MAARGLGLLQGLHALVEAGVDVGLAVRVDRAQAALEVGDGTQRRPLDDPVGPLVEGDHAQLVGRLEGGRRTQDRLLADVDLAHAGELDGLVAVEGVAVTGGHRARLVDDDDERHGGLLLAVADPHLDGQRRLQGRVPVAARAVAARAADHHQPLAEVAGRGSERLELPRGEANARHVDEDHAVVAGQRRRVVGDELREHGHDVALAGAERCDEVCGDGLVARHDEDPGRPGDERRGVGPVVLGERVPGSLDDGPEDVEAGLLRGDVEADPGDARVERRALGGDVGAVRDRAGSWPAGRRSSESPPSPRAPRRAAMSWAR